MGTFDVNRAQLSDKDMFKPFEVMATQPSEAVIASGEVRGDKPVLVIVRDVGVLVLLARQMTYHHVAEALSSYPRAQVAVAKQSVKQKLMPRIFEYSRKSEHGYMPPCFLPTLGEEDTRRPRMERGLGVWLDSTRRFYPLKRLRAHRGALVDELAGRRLLVYLDPVSKVPAAFYTEATRSTLGGQGTLPEHRRDPPKWVALR